MNTHYVSWVLWDGDDEGVEIETTMATAEALYQTLRHNERVKTVCTGPIRYRRQLPLHEVVKRAGEGKVSVLQRDGHTYLDIRSSTGQRQWYDVEFRATEIDCPF